MKKTIFLLPLYLFLFTAYSQISPDNIQKIDVTGSAEMEIIPDEIYFTIILEEYIPDKNQDKISIETLEKQLQSSLTAAGIPKENLGIENVYGENWVYKKKKQKDFLEKKQYSLKLNDPSKIDP